MGMLAWVGLCLLAGGLGAMATSSSVGSWYQTIAKPEWNPPDSVFGPVWTTLFVLMGLSAWLVWSRAGFRRARVPLCLFFAQLLLNIMWSFIFFGQRQPGWAFAEIIALWCTIVATTLAFYRQRPAAGWLMTPYLAWTTFAAALNFAIWQLN